MSADLPALGQPFSPPENISSPFVQEEKTRFEQFLELGNRVYLLFHGFISRLYPPKFNPLAQTGAIANTTFIIACISGILLLIWYKPSVHEAYSSMETISGLSLTAGLLRSIHRYSSDGCMFFVVLHAIQMFFGNRFKGARWLGWVTGVGAMTLLWFVGWTGYWLVWDERAQMIATTSAKLLDMVPIFSDPLSRSFLVDGTINSLFFFIIFFLHMLVPLSIGGALWLHIVRLSRPKFLADKKTTYWILASLLLVSLILPATAEAPAQMLLSPDRFSMDWWYLTPVWIIDRLSGGFFWVLFLVMGLVLYSLPFWRTGRKRAPAMVTESRCNACRKCVMDCPFEAISMVPRTDDKNFEGRSLVDPERCVACGICAGSCNSAGIGLPSVPVIPQRHALESLLEQEPGAWFAFVCGESTQLKIDPESALCKALPGYRVMPVTCIGSIHMLTLERLLRRGAGGILIAGCGSGSCKYREGVNLTELRLQGARNPIFRKERADIEKIRQIAFQDKRTLRREAAAFLRGEKERASRLSPLLKLTLATLLLIGLTLLPVNLPYQPAVGSKPQLVVSFKHAGAEKEAHKLTQEELEKLPMHMRQAEVKERGHAPVRLRVVVDGQEIVNKAYSAGGLMGDGSSVALETLPLEVGAHHVVVYLGDEADENVWNHQTEKHLSLAEFTRCVLLFDKANGFTWHMKEE